MISIDTQENILKAINGNKPASVPIFVPSCDRSFLKNFYNYHDKIDKKHICFCNNRDLTPLVYYKVDCCEVPGPPHQPPREKLPELDDNKFLDIYGRIYKKIFISGNEYLVYQGPYLGSEDRIQNWPHIIPQQIEPGWSDRIYEQILDCVDNHHICPIFEGCNGFYSILENSIGIELAAELFHDYPELINLQLEKIFETIRSDIKGILDAGGAFVMIKDNISVGTRPSITPDLVEKHLLDFYRRFVSLIHEKGGKAFFETGGNATNIIDIIIKAGFDAINVKNQDLNILRDIKTFWGANICVMGNFSIEKLKQDTTPTQIKKNV
ncbi:MAG: uroporphyrinogen decarboxylase family protein, partial [Promethearchaeota archaeon]